MNYELQKQLQSDAGLTLNSTSSNSLDGDIGPTVGSLEEVQASDTTEKEKLRKTSRLDSIEFRVRLFEKEKLRKILRLDSLEFRV